MEVVKPNKTKASTKSTKATEEDIAVKTCPDVDESPQKMSEQIRKLNDGEKVAATRTTRRNRSKNFETSSFEGHLAELDVDSSASEGDGTDEDEQFVAPGKKTAAATQKTDKTVQPTKKRNKEGKPAAAKKEKAAAEKKEKPAKEEKKAGGGKAPKEEKKNASDVKKAADPKKGGKEKEKVPDKIMDVKETKKAIEEYMVKHNRPYSL